MKEYKKRKRDKQIEKPKKKQLTQKEIDEIAGGPIIRNDGLP